MLKNDSLELETWNLQLATGWFFMPHRVRRLVRPSRRQRRKPEAKAEA
jgi:hypothetical protein